MTDAIRNWIEAEAALNGMTATFQRLPRDAAGRIVNDPVPGGTNDYELFLTAPLGTAGPDRDKAAGLAVTFRPDELAGPGAMDVVRCRWRMAMLSIWGFIAGEFAKDRCEVAPAGTTQP